MANRSAIVGQYPTAGLGGGVEDFFMPDDLRIRMTIARAVDANGNIHIEGRGIVPTVQVPVNEETLFSDGDPVLEAAVNYLNNNLGN
ncbi:MAG: S41 family peptidase [Anaerolineae bacterium]|nr:S41 family peptidase [Anaerolineae bacterium]